MIDLMNVSKDFGGIKAVDSVSLRIEDGEMLGLVGPNGSGKSTLLKMIIGILKPSSGKVGIEGKELSEKEWRGFRRRIGYMPERVSFYDNLSGRETLDLFARVKGGKVGSMDDILKKVVLADALDRKVGGYSKGMRQRLNLAQALSNDPDLLILDEPTSGLDPEGTREFYEILNMVKGRKRLTVIFSSHILAEIEERIDRVAIMKNGNLKAVGSLEELYTELKLPLRISISLHKRDEALEELLKKEGALNIFHKDDHLLASIPRQEKLRILSAILKERDRFVDFTITEPSLEEVFFGVH